MKKVFLMLILVGSLSMTTKIYSQDLQIGASGGLVVPFIDFGDVVQAGLGGSLMFKYFATDHLALGMNVGYYSFPGRELDFGLGFGGIQVAPTVNIIPINATAELYIGRSEELRPRIGLDFGGYIISSQGVEDSSELYFGFAPLIGSGYRISKNLEIFADTKFHVILTSNSTDDIPTTSYLSVKE